MKKIVLCLLLTGCGNPKHFTLEKTEWICTSTAMRSVISRLRSDTTSYPPASYDQVECQQWTSKDMVAKKKRKKK